LAYTYSPNSGDMVIDTADSFYSANKNWAWQVVAHELGHALGIAHSCPMSQTKLMEPYFSTAFAGPQVDDILASQAYYGDKYEPNNVYSRSYGLGSISGSKAITTAGLHSATDTDYFSFVAGATGSATVVVVPNGQTYSVGAVGGGGVANSCSGTFPSVNTLTVYNLNVNIYNSAQALLGSASAASAGFPESLTVQVTAGSTYYVRVLTSATATPTSNYVQMYNMTVSVAASSNVVGVSSTPAASASHSSVASASPSTVASVSRSPAAAVSHSSVASASHAAVGVSVSPSHSKVNVPSASHSKSKTPLPSRSRRPRFWGRDGVEEDSDEVAPTITIDIHPAPVESEEEPVIQIDVHPSPLPPTNE